MGREHPSQGTSENEKRQRHAKTQKTCDNDNTDNTDNDMRKHRRQQKLKVLHITRFIYINTRRKISNKKQKQKQNWT